MDWRPSIRIEMYLAGAGCPFQEWLDRLRDRVGRAKVRVQIDRLSLGNFGNCRFLKGGIGEVKVAWGPGYRVYFARLNPSSILLLCGGDKATQQADIARALEYWSDYQEKRHGKPS